MPKRNYPDWIEGFLRYASYTEAPRKTLYWTAVSTIAGALRRRVWIDQKFFVWTPNFYIVLVAPPGIISKSTTINVGLNLLRQVPGIHFGPDVVTWQALLKTMEEAGELVPIPGTDKMLPMSAITVGSDEFGTFLDPNNREMLDVLVSLWDGKRGTFRKVTKTSGNDFIENPWINIIGCTTPSWISKNFPEYMIGGGFTSRCIFIHADKKRQLSPYPGLSVSRDFESQQKALIEDLTHIATELVGEYGLTDDAVRWGCQWYSRHWTNPPEHLKAPEYEGYIARKQTHLHKLAMVLAASRRDILLIEESDLIEADRILTNLEHEMGPVFRKIGLSPIAQIVDTLKYHFLPEGEEKPQTVVLNYLLKKHDINMANLAISSALAAGWLVAELRSDGKVWLKHLKASSAT